MHFGICRLRAWQRLPPRAPGPCPATAFANATAAASVQLTMRGCHDSAATSGLPFRKLFWGFSGKHMHCDVLRNFVRQHGAHVVYDPNGCDMWCTAAQAQAAHCAVRLGARSFRVESPWLRSGGVTLYNGSDLTPLTAAAASRIAALSSPQSAAGTTIATADELVADGEDRPTIDDMEGSSGPVAARGGGMLPRTITDALPASEASPYRWYPSGAPIPAASLSRLAAAYPEAFPEFHAGVPSPPSTVLHVQKLSAGPSSCDTGSDSVPSAPVESSPAPESPVPATGALDCVLPATPVRHFMANPPLWLKRAITDFSAAPSFTLERGSRYRVQVFEVTHIKWHLDLRSAARNFVFPSRRHLPHDIRLKLIAAIEAAQRVRDLPLWHSTANLPPSDTWYTIKSLQSVGRFRRLGAPVFTLDLADLTPGSATGGDGTWAAVRILRLVNAGDLLPCGSLRPSTPPFVPSEDACCMVPPVSVDDDDWDDDAPAEERKQLLAHLDAVQDLQCSGQDFANELGTQCQ